MFQLAELSGVFFDDHDSGQAITAAAPYLTLCGYATRTRSTRSAAGLPIGACATYSRIRHRTSEQRAAAYACNY